MNITKTQEATTLTIIIDGGIDSETAPELEDALNNSYTDITDLTLDFEKVEFISSAGIRVLIQARKAMQGKGEYKIINVKDIIYDVFEMTGITKMITVETAN